MEGRTMQKFSIKNSISRVIDIFNIGAAGVPEALYSVKNEYIDVWDIEYPLPARKKDYKFGIEINGVKWLAADNGVTRYDAKAEKEVDTVMYFSADRDLNDNKVQALYSDSSDPESVWVLTETGVSHIVLSEIDPDDKAEVLTQETLKYVDRRGMVTQRVLTVPREKDSHVPYGHSDNSGTFTAGFAVGELFRYATMKRELGPDHEKTKAARKNAVRATEACQLLMYLPGRGDGFVARTYMVPTEPYPDDGLFYRKEGGKAVCLSTTFAKKKGMAGMVIDASHPVPERLAKLYKDAGYSDDGIVYKGDTSSDEITLHYLLIYFAHEILGEEDPELDELLKGSAKATLKHILTHNNELWECNGKPTTWAKWSTDYFATMLGWSDGCLNSAQLLMYLKVVMHITGEKGEWQEAYDRLIAEGYAERATLHEMRFALSSMADGVETVENLMYGDNMLATAAYWILIELEDDEKMKNLFREGYKGWNSTFRREHNPVYDFPYLLACPDEKVDTDMLEDWFRRFGMTRLCSNVSMQARKDLPVKTRYGGETETSWLLTMDEMLVSKYDRNPYRFEVSRDHRGLFVLESCYVYTCAYWMGRYFGFIDN